MGLRITTNVPSINAQRQMGNTQRELAKSYAQLSSGSRITKSADDAAGLAISERLKSTIRGYHQARRNAEDGMSMVQVAEGGMNEVSNMLVRLRELAVQTASDTIGDRERKFVDAEVQQLKKKSSELPRQPNSARPNFSTAVVENSTFKWILITTTFKTVFLSMRANRTLN